MDTAVLLHRAPLWLDAVEQALERSGVSTLAKLTRPSAALAWVVEHEPSIVVVDVDAFDGELDGFGCLAEVCARIPGVRVVAVTTDDAAAIAAGAAECAPPRSGPNGVIEALERLAAQPDAESCAFASSAHATASR